MAKARYIMIGGFLAPERQPPFSNLRNTWHSQGTRVGLITNDQSFGLVDTALARFARVCP